MFRPTINNSAHTDSFYHLSVESAGEQLCRGAACFVARQTNLDRWSEALRREPRVYCLGGCFSGPASSLDAVRPKMESRSREPIILGPILKGPCRHLAAYTADGGYRVLARALDEPREDLLSVVEDSGLRGRGGAGFPTGKKWRAVAVQNAAEKFVVANADEGDPGAYIDRFLVEDIPHRLIEAMAIAGYAVGSAKGYIYLRKEYTQASEIMRQALEEAYREHFLGDDILGRNFRFDLELVIGRGSYICGEETALLNSIEGRRPEVRLRPPYPSEHGLFQMPTLINNVETLASIPWVVTHGADAFRRMGFAKSQGSKVLSLNSLFHSPGLYEVEFGITVRQIVEELGGGLRTGKPVKGVIIGGPLAGIVPPHLLETPLGFEELAGIGAAVGHGGVIAFDEYTSIPELIHHVFDFAAFESCGKCTPCRLGSRRIEQMFRHILATEPLSQTEKEEWLGIDSALWMTSLCGLGAGLAEFAMSAARYYAEELDSCFK